MTTSFGKYRPDPSGLRAIGRSPQLGLLCAQAAERIAARANDLDGSGRYKASAAVVASGWENEPRAGGRVEQTRRGRARAEALQRALNSY